MGFAFVQSKMRLFISEQDRLQQAQVCFSFLVDKKPQKTLLDAGVWLNAGWQVTEPTSVLVLGQIKGRNAGRAPRDMLPMRDGWGSHCC